MSNWTTKAVAKLVKGNLFGDPDLKVHGCILDSRQAQGGEMFFALPGERVDGHDYIDAAWNNGALLVIADEARFRGTGEPRVPEGKALLLVESVYKTLQDLAQYWRRELKAKVVGVTGSNGKTTTKDMIYAVLSQEFQVYRNKENHNNELGLPMTILNAPLGTEVLILEMGMRGLGEIKALCDIGKPDIGVITNIGTTHLELLLTQERIAQAKWELIDALPEGGVAIINAEDQFSVEKARKDLKHQISYYGIEGSFADPIIRGVQLRPWGELGTAFDVLYKDQRVTANLPLPGTHNVLDALAALNVGTMLGVSLDKGCTGLSKLELSRMRLEIRRGVSESVIINDVYNANPVSMQASLQVLKERGVGNRTLAILGEMYELGISAESGHREVGRALSDLGINELITVGKLAEEIAQGARLAGFPENHITVTYSREEAVKEALRLLALGQGTWVLIKGSRGMRMEEITAKLER
ncbi:UDP-N-acetylmuramoyl-tripeptide--D-alanyl-D-alanine ligase [Desulfosporosinus sp. HMP52]|uniref:UDP-N-acetylmuramoyl-tripeptide--D-alanyl-D- alanine ligase n=1 Tax=Desulfosporosinus sp. HMP52 TaxID=1487923 RepID=UPI00051FCC61|nr:UDP-N-acetylmuramoyl-tripeptide--D-alanyl-D-alanine ligase [Desulfosporosinus sp. HMP52]KGK90411.1 UDP-N-acetylmuramoyl-tripeptide--D-alanyl-D-alanine ligase [Desulfosporosinus sp. HMP52]